jgi:hypothetical protein
MHVNGGRVEETRAAMKLHCGFNKASTKAPETHDCFFLLFFFSGE